MAVGLDNSISFINLSLGYKGAAVINNICIDVPRGAFLPIVGPNGSGKSTLVKATLGLLQPLSGYVRFSNPNLPIGYVSQESAIEKYFPVSAIDIVLMGFFHHFGSANNHLNWRKLLSFQSCNKARSEAIKLLEELDLAAPPEQSFWELSGGQKQKVLIARALALDPEILVMDEPTTELDSISQKRVLETLYTASRHFGKTVIFAHHGLGALEGFTEEVCLVRDRQASVVPLATIRGLSNE